MMKRILLVVSMLILAFAQSSFAQPSIEKSRTVKSLEKTFEEVLESYNCPGMSVVVVNKDEIIYAKGFGYADVENQRKVDAATLLPIGSSTKAYTAVLAGQLEEQGKLDLDKSPREYLPELSFYNDQMNNLITVRDMLSHQTGLPRHDWSWYLFPSSSRDSLIQRIKYQQPTEKVRKTFQYNNFMYMAVGALIEKLSSETWEQSIYEYILKPLQMKNTCVSITEMEQKANRAIGYAQENDVHKKLDYYHIRGMAPAGSINSNAMEIGNWLSAWINGGEYKGKQVIPKAFLTEAISSQVAISGGMPGKSHPDVFFSNYGLGWFLSSYRGHYRVEHGGNIDGFSSSVAFFPMDSIGIAVLVNQNYSAVPSRIRNIIADKMLGLPDGKWYVASKMSDKKDSDKEKISEVINRVQGTTYSHELAAYQGLYSNPGYGSFNVKLKNDSLLAYFPEVQFWLWHKHYDVFEPYNLEDEIDTTVNADFSFNFHSNIHGEIDGIYLNVETGIDPLFFGRHVEKLQLKPEELTKFVGKYDLGGAFAEVFINDKNHLSLLVPGQPEYFLTAKKKNKFTIEKLDGYELEFEEKEGAVTALVLIQPDGTFRVPRKQ